MATGVYVCVCLWVCNVCGSEGLGTISHKGVQAVRMTVSQPASV